MRQDEPNLDRIIITLLGISILMAALVFLRIVSTSANAQGNSKSFEVQWSNPAFREDGTDFAAGEFEGVQITYWKDTNRRFVEFVEGRPSETKAYQIRGLKGGWWSVYLEAVSRCATKNDVIFGEYKCYSDQTATQRVRAR